MADPTNQLIMGALGVNTKQLPFKKKKKEKEVQYAVDNELEVLVMLVLGTKGEQHKIFQFSVSHCENKNEPIPIFVTNRAGNTYLEFN